MSENFSKCNGEGTLLREARNRMLEVLIEVDKICRKHNIPYWLDGGTLFGTVRHGVFIPWDDDLDIALMRDDYKKLCKILKRELPDNLAFQDSHTDCFPIQEMEFENHKFLVPANPDAYLKAFYGNYMQIPPEEKRLVHSGKIEIYHK
jgi:LPS biosynthesis protein